MCLVGVGGGGCNILNDIKSFSKNHKFIFINNDMKVLEQIEFSKKIYIPTCDDNMIDVKIKKAFCDLLKNEKSIHLIATLGGNFASNAMIEIVKMLKESDKDVYVYVTLPFVFEGIRKMDIAKNSIEYLKRIEINSLNIFDNNDFLKIRDYESIEDIFKMISNKIYEKIKEESIC